MTAWRKRQSKQRHLEKGKILSSRETQMTLRAMNREKCNSKIQMSKASMTTKTKVSKADQVLQRRAKAFRDKLSITTKL
jgi:hypothetical protein